MKRLIKALQGGKNNREHSPVRDAAGAGDEHLLPVAERRHRGPVARGGGGLGVGGRVLEAEERALRARRRGVVGLLCAGRLCRGVGALPLLRHGFRVGSKARRRRRTVKA